ncbi:MAG TPA: zinc-dependent metalloprotease [Vicinamibacterales bacterium]|nr:zinc-dependent metalloprotease [Vicinamibacterales bacterium]
MGNKHVAAWSVALVCGACLGIGAVAPQALRAMAGQSAGAAAPQGRGGGAGGGGAQGGGNQGGRAGGIVVVRNYADVITGAAKTQDGIFKVHRITDANSDQLFYEIPRAELNKDFLWNTQLKKTTIGAGYGGQAVGTRVVRWLLKDNRILLVNMDYSSVADPSTVLMDEANQPAIIQAFPVAAYKGDDKNAGDPVINVTALFTGNVPEFAAGRGVGGNGAPDPSRTFLEKANAYPLNINVEVTATWAIAEQAADAAGGGGGGRGGRGGGGRNPSATVLVHHSMVKLPEKPMMPRLFDERVGYFTQGLTDYGTGEQQQMQKRFITRYRLEKKDPNAAISDPVKPITYYIDPETPKKWVPCIKEAIESWQPAFELAGFRKGIVAKEASESGDPNWSREDVRYSTIDYLPSTTENAVGPHVHDPRSGEILEADVQYYHNVMNLAKNWYFVQAGPNDPRAQQLPLPDDLMCNLVKYVVAHEVGHTLGFQHNMKASSTYTIEQIRDPKWVKENGHTPTLMDYSRFNYVAQPEDKIDPIDLIPKIGPYDKWATHWGYAPIPGARTPEEEKPTLDKWARDQDEKPYLRFSTEGGAATDPGDETEAVGDIDATKATALGIKNLARVSEMLMKATNYKTGAPYDELEEVYGRMVGQWTTEMNHVVKVIGGIESQQKHIGQTGVRFVTVAKSRQQEALQFLINNAFTVPSFMIRPEILRLIQPTGIITRVSGAQGGIMSGLLNQGRLDRMSEQLALDGPTIAYSPSQFLADLRAGVWSELAKPGTPINIYRRNVQRSYLDNMEGRLYGTSEEVRAMVRSELKTLDGQLRTALASPATTDDLTKRHLQDCRDEIAAMLDPMVPRPARAGGAGFGGGRGGIRR